MENLKSIFFYSNDKFFDDIHFDKVKSKLIISNLIQNNNPHNQTKFSFSNLSNMKSNFSYSMKSSILNQKSEIKNPKSFFIKTKKITVCSIFKYSFFYVIEIKFKKHLFSNLKKKIQQNFFIFLDFTKMEKFLIILKQNKSKFLASVNFELKKVKEEFNYISHEENKSKQKRRGKFLSNSLLPSFKIKNKKYLKKHPNQNKIIFSKGNLFFSNKF